MVAEIIAKSALRHYYRARNTTPTMTIAINDALARCEIAAAGMGLCVGGALPELEVSFPPPVVEFEAGAGPGFVTLKKFPATTLSANPAVVRTLWASKPSRLAAAVLRVANSSSDVADVSTRICV